MNNHYSWDEISLISSDSQSNLQYPSVQFSSVAQSCPTLCDPINRSMPGLPVHHQLPEFTQTHVQHLLISWLQSPSAVIWEPPKIKSDTVSTVSPSISHEDRGTRDQIANIHWIIEKAREFQKNIYFCFIDCTKAFNCVDHDELWKILQEMGIPDRLTCIL